MGHTSNNIDDPCKQVGVNNEAKELLIITKELVNKESKEVLNNNNNNKESNEVVKEPNFIIQAIRKPIKGVFHEPFGENNKEGIRSSMSKGGPLHEKHLAIMKGSINKIKAISNKNKGLPLVRVIQMSPPTLVTTKPEDFMSVVQQLTGSPSSSSSKPISSTPILHTQDPNLHLIAFDCDALLQTSSSLVIDDAHDDNSLDHHDDEPSSNSRFSFDACFNGLDGLGALADPFEAQSILSSQFSDDHECPAHHEDCHYNPLQWDLATLHDMFDGEQQQQLPQVGATPVSAAAQLLNSYAFSAARDAHYHLIAS